MIIYKNISYSAKTFYGVEFKPGEIKAVPGYINCQGMLRMPDSTNVTERSEVSKVKPITEDISIPAPTSNRGRRKRSIEPEEGLFAEVQETKIISEEETSDGNPS